MLNFAFAVGLYSEHLVNDIALRGIAMMPVPVLTEIHNVPFFDEPTCECVTENDGGNRTDRRN